MFSSEDEQEDNNVFDQLRSIKPFTIDQLYLLYPDVGCPPSLSTTQQANDGSTQAPDQDKEVYQNLVEYEHLRHKLFELRSQVKKIYKKTHEYVDKAWMFKEESTRKIAMCQQGKIAETTFKYRQAFVSSKQLDAFALGFSQLIESITKDYIYYSFESQMKRNKIATKLSFSYQINEIHQRQDKLKSLVVTIMEFIKHLGDSKSDFVVQCRKWFRALAKRILEEDTTENYCFVISQLARGPAGTAAWSSDLIECKPFEQTTSFESIPHYITHCSALLTSLFRALRFRIETVAAAEEATSSSKNIDGEIDNIDGASTTADQNWSLVDPRFACTEELNITSSSVLLSEADVMKFCLRIPVAQIFRSYVKKCLANGDGWFHTETDKNFEYIMLKLLTIGTIIIKTYQVGLETFNSIQYGSLIEYLSSQIRRTVIILSEKWNEFKNRLRGVDDALLMRLQVEYDNFMLRSILIILELRQSGIWRHLSRIERSDCEGLSCEIEEGNQGWSTDSFRPALAKLLQVAGLSNQSSNNQANDEAGGRSQVNVRHHHSSPNSLTYEFSIEWFIEVSEPMLWHILWQFYHNAFVSSCEYNSDNYWLEKFGEKSVVYLFVNKIKESPTGECSYLLSSITSMLLSRTRPDSKLVNFIAREIFSLSYKHKALRDKVTKLGTRSLIRSAEKFPTLISLYLTLMSDIDLSEPDVHASDLIDLIEGCSLRGWLCNDDELDLLSSWLTDHPIDSTENKISRIILSKILLNSPDSRDDIPPIPAVQRTPGKQSRRESTVSSSVKSSLISNNFCFVDLKLRRKLALLLYEAAAKHLLENSEFGPLSLGASVEVAFGGLYCEQNATMQNNLIELAVGVTYQQFYIWTCRLLFTLRLHILDQSETDWNDLKSRSGTSRSVKNTVLIGDSFHPAPAIQDSECQSLADGMKKQIPMASFLYLMLTDATWQSDTFEDCLVNLNILASSGHITQSLMGLKFFTICHLNDLCETAIKDKRCLDYFTTIISSNFDETRFASLIMSQLDHLKQYRQLQLSQFYVHVLLEVASIVSRQNSASWFTTNEMSLEKIVCILDYLVKFNFPTQRTEIIHKFYDCAYVIHDGTGQQSAGWFGSLITSNAVNASTTKREFLTNLHMLSQKFKKYTWLRWITTECDALRLEKIWEDIVAHLSSNEEANLDSSIKRVCPQMNPTILKQILPIHSWTRQIFDIMESDLSHPLCPLIWYNFFSNYFANSLNGTSVGYKLVQQETVMKLMSRLDALFNYHLYKQRNWSSAGIPKEQNSLAQLYRAFKLWLQDSSLRDAYVDMDKLREDYLVPLLKAVMDPSSGSDVYLEYVDLQSISTQNRNLMQVWRTATRLKGNHLIKEMIFVDSTADDSLEILTSVGDEASDAASLLAQQQINSNNSVATKQEIESASKNSQKGVVFPEFSDEELSRPLRDDMKLDDGEYATMEESLALIRKNFNSVFEEANIFNMNINELDRTKSEIIDLVKQLYKNKKRELVRVVACSDANECIGPARIKVEVEEAMMDERKSHCIQDRRRQCQELVGELLLMPKNRSIQSTVVIEQNIRRLIGDPMRSRQTIETLLHWMSETKNYSHLSGTYYVANHLLKTCLEILATSDQIDTFNTALIDVCLEHPESVQIFSPHLSPSSCSKECFLQLYRTITGEKQIQLGPTATFVLLSKFDLASWLDNLNKQKDKPMQHGLIIATCSAFKNMGKDPDESFELALGLFRRHLQIELALPDRRRPEELMLVLSEFLKLMNEQKLTPKLWVDFMTIMGFETRKKHNIHESKLARAVSSPKRATLTKSPSLDDSALSLVFKTLIGQEQHDESSIENVVDDVTRQADCQTIFDYHSIDLLIKMLTNFMQQQNDSSNVTLLELYTDYLDKYATFMLSVTFIWIRATSKQYPDNHSLIWKQFMDLWGDWVFLVKSCQNVSKSSYSLVVNYFVSAVRYMILRISDNTQAILQSVLSDLASYIAETREVVYLELTILQRSLKNLPWSNLIAGPDDYEHLCALSEQENYNVSDLISHIVSQLDVKRSLATIDQLAVERNDSMLMPRVAERLAATIILQSAHLKGYRLHGIYFSQIPVDQISRLANLILQRMGSVNLEHNQNNKLLVNLLRFICIRLDTSASVRANSTFGSNNHVLHPDDGYKRSLIYAQFVSDYLVDLIKRHPSVTNCNRDYLAAVLDNSLQDLKPVLLSSDLNLTQKTLMYEALLECCSSDAIELEQRLLLKQLIFEASLLKNRPLVLLEILNASGQVLRDSRVLVAAIEELILMYLNMNGYYEKVWKSFCLKVLPSDIYLTTCIELKASLALLVYFESLARGNMHLHEPHITGTDLTSSKDGDVDNQTGPDIMSQSSSSALASSFNNNRVWASFFHWIAQLVSAIASRGSSVSETTIADTKLATILLRMLELLEPNLHQYIHGDPRSSGGDATTESRKAQAAQQTDPSKNLNQQMNETQKESQATRETTEAPEAVDNPPKPVKSTRRQQAVDLATKLQSHHRSLLELIKQLLGLFDTLNSASIWSYLTISTRNEHSARLSVTALAVASFLVDRTLATLGIATDEELGDHLLALRSELSKQRKGCLTRLESSRKSKNFLNCTQFIETVIECIERSSEKVQYIEGVQLITTYVRMAFSPPSSNSSSSIGAARTASDQSANDRLVSDALSPTEARSSSESQITVCLNKILPTL